MLRVGIGYDIHRFEAGRKLLLGGVEIPYASGLMGHSDADALAHAVGDALLGACALGDLGDHFPPGEPRWAGASSLGLLERVGDLVHEAGYRIVNVDSVVVAQEPQLKAQRAAMRRTLAAALGLEMDQVSVKVKSPERLGALGRLEGIAAHAIAGVEPAVAGAAEERT